MKRTEEVELTNMCMILDGKGNVLVQNKVCYVHWHGWNFPGGHVEKGEFITPSVIREMKESSAILWQNWSNRDSSSPVLKICWRSLKTLSSAKFIMINQAVKKKPFSVSHC